MNRITVERVEADAKKLYTTAPKKSHWERVLEPPFELHDQYGYQAFAAEIPSEAFEELWSALERMNFGRSARTSGLISQSKVFGFQPRVPVRRDFCCAAACAREYPDEHATIIKWGEWADRAYRMANPTVYDRHVDLIRSRVAPHWVIPGTTFTSGIVNKDNPLRYHRDQGNFDNVWSVMIALPMDLVGGELVMPEFRAKVRFSKPSIFMFDGQQHVHAVTRIQHGHRYSIVYYSLKDMANCLTPAEELARIRRVKTEREYKRLKARKQEE